MHTNTCSQAAWTLLSEMLQYTASLLDLKFLLDSWRKCRSEVSMVMGSPLIQLFTSSPLFLPHSLSPSSLFSSLLPSFLKFSPSFPPFFPPSRSMNSVVCSQACHTVTNPFLPQMRWLLCSAPSNCLPGGCRLQSTPCARYAHLLSLPLPPSHQLSHLV